MRCRSWFAVSSLGIAQTLSFRRHWPCTCSPSTPCPPPFADFNVFLRTCLLSGPFSTCPSAPSPCHYSFCPWAWWSNIVSASLHSPRTFLLLEVTKNFEASMVWHSLIWFAASAPSQGAPSQAPAIPPILFSAPASAFRSVIAASLFFRPPPAPWACRDCQYRTGHSDPLFWLAASSPTSPPPYSPFHLWYSRNWMSARAIRPLTFGGTRCLADRPSGRERPGCPLLIASGLAKHRITAANCIAILVQMNASALWLSGCESIVDERVGD